MKMHMFRETNNIKGNERGFASLVVALTLILILSLITVGFAKLMRREQTNALNKQLSTQAFYAAESGVNDAIKAIQNDQSNIGDGSTCSSLPPTTGPGVFLAQNSGQNLDANSGHNVAYTCVLVNENPDRLFKQKVGDTGKEDSNNNSWNIVGDTSGTNAATLTIKWVSSNGHTNAWPNSAVGKFYPQSASSGTTWGNAPAVLRFSVTPLGGGVDRASLITNTYTAYFYPVTGNSGSASYSTTANQQGQVYGAKCTAIGSTTRANCSIDVSMAGAAAGPYLFHIVSIYDQSDITITAVDGTGNTLKFKDSQAIIDATGKAQDVLRRIQVTYPLQSHVALPSDALEATDICKRMQTNATSTTFDTAFSAKCDLES